MDIGCGAVRLHADAYLEGRRGTLIQFFRER